jgi:hypothetical protein
MNNSRIKRPIIPRNQIIVASGYCHRCKTVHGLPMGEAYLHCRKLIHHFQQNRTIALDPAIASDLQLSTDYLFGKARGKMFGVLDCRRTDGSQTFVQAFSGQYNGLWEVPDWAPPLFDVGEFRITNDHTEKKIKALSRELKSEEPHTEKWLSIKRARKHMSRELMRELHAIYRLNNFQGECSSLFQAYIGNNGIPTGCGDCCAPKLLNYAAAHDLIPVGIAEFYWGLDNKSGTRRHGYCYPSCRDKCQPILGYLLCGLEKKHACK